MDVLSSLLDLDQIDDLFPESPFRIQDLTFQHEPLVSSLEDRNVVFDLDRKRKSSELLAEANEKENSSDSKNKKIMHREVERQRRREMAALNSSLKSLLPPENLKGKRSLCDHMDETLNYIGCMKKKIEELGRKRDELKRSSNALIIYVGSKCLPHNFNVTEPEEEISSGDFQIVLSTGLNAEVSLSRLLKEVASEGLDVISFTSTNINERLVHAIESKVSEGRSINPRELQRKLKSLVGYSCI